MKIPPCRSFCKGDKLFISVRGFNVAAHVPFGAIASNERSGSSGIVKLRDLDGSTFCLDFAIKSYPSVGVLEVDVGKRAAIYERVVSDKRSIEAYRDLGE